MMKKLLCLLLALWLPAAALADTLLLPESTLQIAPDAFAGAASITEVIAPAGLETIGSGAFGECGSLFSVVIPGMDTQIGEDAFSGCAEALLISTMPGSAAMQYAALHHIDYQASTTYRALLIGQNAYTTIGALQAPARDVLRLQNALTRHTGTPYQVTVQQDLTCDGITAAITQTFAGAQPQDVSLLYYSGHGGMGGTLIGVDGNELKASLLRETLDQIPGRKILLVDSCYSGAIIGRSADGTPEDFVEDFISAFSVRTRADLATDGYYVITAAHSTQQSGEKRASVNGEWIYYGIFSRHLCDGLGYDYLANTASDILADANGDGVVTIDELFQYALPKATLEYARQTAQVYPDECTWQSITR